MNWKSVLCAVLVAGLALLGARAMADDRPLSEHWYPSEFGAGDMQGALNRINPCTVMAAAKLIKKGHIATLGKVYEPGIPGFGARSWRIVLPGKPTSQPIGKHGWVYNDEFVTTELGQIGTQFDGPGHIGVRTSKGDLFYNGVELQGDGDQYMLDKLGVDRVAEKPFVCRGVLLDATAYRGMKRLPVPKGGNKNDPGNVNDDDVRGMVKKEGLGEIREADCVFLNTGHGEIWDDVHWRDFSSEEKAKRVAAFNAGSPGFGISACHYLASRKITMWGSDVWASDAFPQENLDEPVECHEQLLNRKGIWNLENLQFRDLLKEKQYEFLFVWSPLKMRGATGSPGNPVAIW